MQNTLQGKEEKMENWVIFAIVAFVCALIVLVYTVLRKKDSDSSSVKKKRAGPPSFDELLREELRQQKGGERLLNVLDFMQRVPAQISRDSNLLRRAVKIEFGVKDRIAQLFLQRIARASRKVAKERREKRAKAKR